MSTQAVAVERLLSRVILAILAMATASCDTSGLSTGIEGTGAKVETVAVAAVTRGPIQIADGADITVNETVWSAATAKITIDGASGQLLDLSRGSVVTVQGERTAQSALASTIDLATTVRGPFRGFDPVTGYLDVMGQTVFGDESTALDISGGPLDSLHVGQVVTISGFLTAKGEIRATRISTSVSGGGLPWIVSGSVTSSDTTRARFEINDLPVTYAESLLSGLPRGAIDIGQAVVVFGSQMDGDGALLAQKLAPYTEALPAIASGDAAVSGIVHSVESDGSFHVGGQPVVRAPGAVAAQTIGEGSYVRVAGALSNGVLHATEIFVLGSGRSYMLDGRIEAIDVASRSFRMLGIQFFVNEWTRPVGGTLTGRAVGEVTSFWAYSNGFVHSFQNPWPNHPTYGVEGSWFNSVAEPSGYSVESVVDFPVQVTSSTRFFLTYRGGDGDCYGADPISDAEFWQRATGPRPSGITGMYQWGQRLEAGVLIADEVWLCYPSQSAASDQ